MKTLLNSLLYLSIGLVFVLSSCSKDDDDHTGTDIDQVIGSYRVQVFLNNSSVSVVKSTLTVAKYGNNLKTSGSVQFEQLGKIDLDLVLSSLNTFKGTFEEKDVSVAYNDTYFLIAKQKIKVGSKGSFEFEGISEFEGDNDQPFDGYVGSYTVSGAGSSVTGKELAFTIRGAVTDFGDVTISVEPDDQ